MASKEEHVRYLQQCLALARLSPPKDTNFRVGCVITSTSSAGTTSVLSTGYTLELPGNTHAEQSALSKLATQHNVSEDALGEVLMPEVNATLYTSLEPCGKRLSGNAPCVERIIATRAKDANAGIRKVVFGAKEPGTFVQDSGSLKRLDDAGVLWEYVPDLEAEILEVAKAGHKKDSSGTSENAAKAGSQAGRKGTNVDDITPEERARQTALPRNPKKRMMEVPPQE